MPLTELEKVAVFFVAIGPERAEALLKRLGTDAAMQIAGAMKRLGRVSAEMKQAVLQEMLEILSGGRRPERLRGTQAVPPGEATIPTGPQDELLRRVSDLFDRDVDVRSLNWEEAGFNFGSPPLKPPDEDEDDPPTRRR